MEKTNNGTFDAKAHWQGIYEKKGPEEVSWFQPVPSVSLQLFETYNVPPDARVIDVGGGDSLLVDHLLDRGHTNVTVLDISGAALRKAQARLGTRSSLVKWIEADATRFMPDGTFDVWHDRAVFHFLTEPAQVALYLEQIARYLRPGGLLILGTFSLIGPDKCSGIPVQRYDERTMVQHLTEICERVKCFTVDHVTPFNTVQNFLFCAFRRKP